MASVNTGILTAIFRPKLLVESVDFFQTKVCRITSVVVSLFFSRPWNSLCRAVILNLSPLKGTPGSVRR